ncbi:MAG: nitroreductase family protein [Clostridia bacterium]|nr:nitroreductase family protein [Clostridia bacterium]
MELTEAIEKRHSVRAYTDERIEDEAREELERLIEACNRESGLHMQPVWDEPEAFDGWMAHYGKFSGVRNYVAIVGKRGAQWEEKCGYYGEEVVLRAQQLGLNSCWVAMTYSKGKARFEVRENEKLCLVIALGYGKTQGTEHRSKRPEDVMRAGGAVPAWFQEGIRLALLAPTAMNQQKFTFALEGDTVRAKAGLGFYSRIDLGIAKCHFEIGAKKESFVWAKDGIK